MIKPLNATQLSAAKPRTGLQSIGELMPRLIRQYELQAELMRRRAEQTNVASNRKAERDGHAANNCGLRTAGNLGISETSSAPARQATFAWND